MTVPKRPSQEPRPMSDRRLRVALAWSVAWIGALSALNSEKSLAIEPPVRLHPAGTFVEEAAGYAQYAPEALVGKAAPDVNLKMLEKGEFRLKEQRDAKVVMLDFWATWCGPCVAELPTLAQVAKEYQDKGVIFCAVNEQEKNDE